MSNALHAAFMAGVEYAFGPYDANKAIKADREKAFEVWRFHWVTEQRKKRYPGLEDGETTGSRAGGTVGSKQETDGGRSPSDARSQTILGVCYCRGEGFKRHNKSEHFRDYHHPFNSA